MTVTEQQRRQSGLKSGGRGSGSKISNFVLKFLKTFDFSTQISKRFRFLFRRKFPNDFSFLLIYSKVSVYPDKFATYIYIKILGKLFYFACKVTIFEHTSCT